MNFYQRAESFPPILVRLLARTKPGGPPMTSREIADRMGKNGASALYVEEVSQSMGWGDFSHLRMKQFTTACHLDFCNPKQMRRVDDYLRQGASLRHLRVHPLWKSYWLPMLLRWRGAYPVDLSKIDIHPPVRDLLARLTPLIKKPI